MKSIRNCRHGGSGGDDDVRFMAKVNKGAQKIMITVPDQLSVVFMWSLLTGVFIVILMAATCVVLRIESPPPAPLAASQTSRGERCATASRHPLVARLDVGPDDVHYVFSSDDDRIPQRSACSLESAVNASSGDVGGRVNVFVVGGIERVPNRNRTIPEVSLSSTLTDLKDMYGHDRLNVLHVSLEECLECSPFQGMDDLSGRPALAEFAVRLVVLWQFGGTVLDDGVAVVRGHVYRATGAAAEYGDRTISSRVACHAFVYQAMLGAKRFALGGEPFAPNTGRTIVSAAAATGEDARPVADWIMCRGGVAVDDRCCYAETVVGLHGNLCPVAIGEPLSPRFQEAAVQTTTTDATARTTKTIKNATEFPRIS